jgi:Flp pilus assembly protein TadB
MASPRPGESSVDALSTRAGPEGGDMLSKEDNRRLAQLERQLRREDPDFCERMSGGRTHRRRPSVSLLLAAAVIWVAALILGVTGWWIAGGVAAVCAATVLVAALVSRRRPQRRVDPGVW